MEKEFIKLMEQIMELLINDNYTSFLSDDGKFHFVDKEGQIDFQATLGNHNYYLRDNISNYTLIATRNYIVDGIFIRQVILDNEVSHYYISFFTKGDYHGLVKIISKDEKGTLTCSNPDCINVLNSETELKEYVNAFFEEEIDDEDFTDEEFDMEQDMENFQKAMLELSNANNDEYDQEMQPEFMEDEMYEEAEDEDLIENEFEITINGKEITGEQKIKVVSSCAIDLTNRHYRLKDVEMFAENLKMLLEEKMREIERER